MTVDALLNVLLAVAIPIILAIAGGWLAVRALPENEKRKEKYRWIIFFVFTFAAAVVLGVWQQVRATTEQREADAKHNQEQREADAKDNKEVQTQVAALKYTQGQLDSIKTVLANVVNSANGNNSLNASVLKGLLSAAKTTSSGVQPPAIQQMTNVQLRDKVLQFAEELRDMAAKFEPQMEESMDAQKNAMLAATSEDQRKKIWDEGTAQTKAVFDSQNVQIQNCCVIPAIEYKDELLRRLGPPDPQADEKRFPFTFLTESQIAPPIVTADELSPTADYLEYLAGKLPKK